MELDGEQQARIREWVEQDGCGVGSILGQGGDLSVSLVSTLWGSVQKMDNFTKIIFVRDSDEEAEVLGQQLLMCEEEELGAMVEQCADAQSLPMATIVVMTYRQLLRVLEDRRHRMNFPARAVVVFEQELGPGWENRAAREQVAAIAHRLADNKHASIRVLGLSYFAESSSWLDRAAEVVGDRGSKATLDMAVGGTGPSRTEASNVVWDDDAGLDKILREIDLVTTKGENVMVCGGRTDETASRLMQEVKAKVKLVPALTLSFQLFPSTINNQQTPDWRRWIDGLFVNQGRMVTVVSVPLDACSAPLPLPNLGLVILLSGPEYGSLYNAELSTRVDCKPLPLQQEYEIMSRSGCWPEGGAQSRPKVVRCFTNEEFDQFPRDPSTARLRKAVRTPLEFMLQLVGVYSGQTLKEMPMIESRADMDEQTTLLAIMGLIESDDGRLHITSVGRIVLVLLEEYSFGTAVMCARAKGLELKIAKSIVWLAMIGEYWEALFSYCGLSADETPPAVFHEACEDVLCMVEKGGPGFPHSRKGCLWMVWVALEDASLERDAGTLPEYIKPKVRGAKDGAVFQLRALGLELIKAGVWRMLKLGILPQEDVAADVWAQPLTRREVEEIDLAFIAAYYPQLLVVAFESGGAQLPHPVWSYRTHEEVAVNEAWDALVVESSRDHVARMGLKNHMEFAVAACKGGFYGAEAEGGLIRAECLVMIPFRTWQKFRDTNCSKYVDKRYLERMI